MKAPTIAEFRDKINLCRFVSTVDAELNRIDDIQIVKTTWANVTAKSSIVEQTAAGFRPEVTYEIIIRKQSIVCDCIQWQGKLLKLVEPYYVVDNKYIFMKAVEVV